MRHAGKLNPRRFPDHPRAIITFIEKLGAKVARPVLQRSIVVEWSVGPWRASIHVPANVPNPGRLVERLCRRIAAMFAQQFPRAGVPA